MNTKRQTIWLVSMLSLMVVLSAYYLFSSGTEDLDKLTAGTDQQTTKQIAGQTKVEIQEDGSIIKLPDASMTGTETIDPNNSKETSAQTGTKNTEGTKAVEGSTDSEIIKKATEKVTSGDDYFIQQEIERHDKLTKESEKWLTISADPKQTQAASGEATDNIRRLDETMAKIELIETTLAKDYPHALVQQADDGKWKVTVQAAKLEKKQAVEIIDLVLKEMNIGSDKFAGVQIIQ